LLIWLQFQVFKGSVEARFCRRYRKDQSHMHIRAQPEFHDLRTAGQQRGGFS
jgi:hypothetical protein